MENTIVSPEVSTLAPPSVSILHNTDPFPDENLETLDKDRVDLLKNLQGNVLKGHGRDFSANIFFQFKKEADVRAELEHLHKYVTSAYKQLQESSQFKRFGIPGSLFGNLFLTAKTYKKMGLEKKLDEMFADPNENNIPVFPQNVNFINGMHAAAKELGDIPDDLDKVDIDNIDVNSLSPLQKHFLKDKLKAPFRLDSLEEAYLEGTIDGMLLLADDDEGYLERTCRDVITDLETNHNIEVLAVEMGKALRNDEGEGIEHFGYVDGRSQPLYLASDYKNLSNGKIDLENSTERINEKATKRESGDINIWNPFEPLERVLITDHGTKAKNAFGSYFVFRKLEQDVLRFSMAEQQLADKLKLEGSDRERAGAMVVGRFRDGTPLVKSETDGLIPAKANNFRYDGLDSNFQHDPNSDDRLGLKCPFQAHIRKTNPRQSLDNINDDQETIRKSDERDRARRITRRGITYGNRVKHPNAFQALEDLPTGNVGLLFACFQSSIVKQYAFMQKTWANNINFRIPLIPNNVTTTGIDPVIGQPLGLSDGMPDQHWRKEYGGSSTQNPQTLSDIDLAKDHTTKYCFNNFVKFRGGEFFFAPSIPFLRDAKK